MHFDVETARSISNFYAEKCNSSDRSSYATTSASCDCGHDVIVTAAKLSLSSESATSVIGHRHSLKKINGRRKKTLFIFLRTGGVSGSGGGGGGGGGGGEHSIENLGTTN